MKEELYKTIEILKNQKNNIIKEINKNKNDISKNTEIIINLTNVEKNLKEYYMQLENIEQYVLPNNFYYRSNNNNDNKHFIMENPDNQNKEIKNNYNNHNNKKSKKKNNNLKEYKLREKILSI